jgi:hypothetical protein
LAAAAAMLSLAPPASAAPDPFRLAKAPLLGSMLRASGFSHVRVESRRATFDLASASEYLQLFHDVAWKNRIAARPDSERARLEERVAGAIEPFVTGGRLHLLATSLCASGQKV